MRPLTLTFFLAIVLHLVVGVDVVNALPQCTDPSYRHNCEDTVIYPDDGKYPGVFKDEGMYVGSFKYNKRHGQGTFTWADGNKHVGAYKDGNRHGRGTYTYADGRIKEGTWEAGKFLTVASDTPNFNESEIKIIKKTRDVCAMALRVVGTFHTPFWDDNSPDFVNRAKSLGLTVETCSKIVGASDLSACKNKWRLLNDQQMHSNYGALHKSDEKCVSESFRPAEPKVLRSFVENLYTVKDEADITSKGNKLVCTLALEENSGPWSKTVHSDLYVRNAQSRGLTEQDCARILGETASFASKPGPQLSPALVKRTQEALKSLGFYRGAIDGDAGVQSKSALKQWQKTAGLSETGEIKKDQIAQLESDALKEQTKRAEKRKAKAKQLAEANRIKNPDAIAVIIGNRDYKGDTPDVEFAVNDADAMGEFVLNKLGYRSGNIIDLRDATQAELRATFGSKESYKGRLFDYVRADTSDVIVFYSGHGVPGMSDKRGYLLSVDADPNRAELTGYPVDILLKNLARIPAKSMTVFIDACFSGNTPKGMLVDSMSGLTVEIRQPKKASKGMVVLTASRGDQVASWDKTAKHGLFTKHLLEALNGAADKQSKTGNKDGKVTLGEVKAYLDREMTYQARRRFSRDQHATVSGDLKTVLSAY